MGGGPGGGRNREKLDGPVTPETARIEGVKSVGERHGQRSTRGAGTVRIGYRLESLGPGGVPACTGKPAG